MDLREFNEPTTWCSFIKDNISVDDLPFQNWDNFLHDPAYMLLKNVPTSVTKYIKNDITERKKNRISN